MPRLQTVHKPTHKWFREDSPVAIAIGRKQGGTLWINRLENGRVIERAVCHSATDRLTGYGAGVRANDPHAFAAMRSAWSYTFGRGVPFPDFCEVHDSALTYRS